LKKCAGKFKNYDLFSAINPNPAIFNLLLRCRFHFPLSTRDEVLIFKILSTSGAHRNEL
jgi:hypothetical protein